ncbi:hypothetical protein [Pseudomonas taiwanensis]|uniref:hypothetical protein n=1 Tax=Pseudomonas taiwanensis TaxID=470150 RepID=UPI0015C12BDB|nr:hypothetical protein [Pseudomonas taiwanensis]
MLDPLSWEVGRVALASWTTLVWSLVAPGKIQNTPTRKFPTDLNQTAERYPGNILLEKKSEISATSVQLPMGIASRIQACSYGGSVKRDLLYAS